MTQNNRIRLNIGQIYASRDNQILQTILGSCVSACLYDPVVRIGGMNHILLPGKVDLHSFDANARYGINAMELLVNEICKLGGRRSRLQAKIFGGGHVLEAIAAKDGPGEQNVKFVKDYLAMENIPLIAEDTGGPWTRVLLFHISDFAVYVKRIRAKNTTASEIDKNERRFKKRITREVKQETSITLWDKDSPQNKRGENHE